MFQLSVTDSDVPDHRSADGFIRWLAFRYRTSIAAGVLWGCLWMLTMAVTPYGIGRAVDRVVARDSSGALAWAGILFGLAVLTALGGTMRHRSETAARLGATYCVIQLVTRQVARLGAVLDGRIARGDVVAIGTTDITQIGFLMEAIPRGVSALVAIIAVAAILLAKSLAIVLLVLGGVPALLFGTGVLLRPIQSRAARRRNRQADLTGRAGDIVAGLRVLRGIGGEDAFAERYRHDSRQVRDSGINVAQLESVLQQSGVLLPGLLALAVVWLGADLAVNGELSAGALVSYYAYAAFLGLPMHIVIGLLNSVISGRVAADRVTRVLTLALPPQGSLPPPRLSPDAELADPASGLIVTPGTFTAVVTTAPDEGAALTDRLGGYQDSEVTFDRVPLRQLPMAWVREQILVEDQQARLFSGTLADELGDASPDRVAAALHAANAEDIVQALPDGLQERIGEGGLSLSGGERQRLRLARALLADPPVLILVEPTSAVDATTEAVIARRVRKLRAGRTTMVVTTSPLVLTQADQVAFCSDGTVVATGTHGRLLETVREYADAVLRGQA